MCPLIKTGSCFRVRHQQKLDLLLTPQAFSLFACPAARVFLAALMSRSCALPQTGQVQVLTERDCFPSL